MKDINIVLLNYFSKNDILNAVDSVWRDIENCPFNAQITICDNSENKDGIKNELDSRFPPEADRRGNGHIKYIDCGGNIGFGRGNNMGFAATEARYFFALNPDTVIPAGSQTIEKIIRFLDANPSIGMLGPKLLNADGTIQYSCYRFDFPSIFIKPFKQIHLDKKFKWAAKLVERLEMRDWDHAEARPVDWVMGSAMVARKAATDKVGWFDDRYFMYMEDSDWCRQMWEAGWPVYYAPEIVITHKHARESAKVPGVLKALFKNRLARIHIKSWAKYLWKWKNNFKYYAHKA